MIVVMSIVGVPSRASIIFYMSGSSLGGAMEEFLPRFSTKVQAVLLKSSGSFSSYGLSGSCI